MVRYCITIRCVAVIVALAAFLLSQTSNLIIGAGIANIYARDAVTARQGQHTLFFAFYRN